MIAARSWRGCLRCNCICDNCQDLKSIDYSGFNGINMKY
jgi:hypothetical protein